MENEIPTESIKNFEDKLFDNAAQNSEQVLQSTVKLTEVLPQKLKVNGTHFQIPELVFPFDSQNANIYFDPNLLPNENKKKSKFWKNIKVRGSIGVSGGMGVNRNAVDSPKK